MTPNAKAASGTVASGEKGVAEYLSRRIGPRDPALMERALRAFAALVKKRTNDEGVVRAYILQKTDDLFCRVVYAAMLEGDADDALTIRLDANTQALCLLLKEPVLMRSLAIPTADRQRTATKYLHAARPADVTHAYCIPIFTVHDAWNLPWPADRPTPVAAVGFDFRSWQNEPLLLEPDIEDLFAAVAQSLGEFWSERNLYDPTALPEQAGVAQGDWSELENAPGFFVSNRKVRARVDDSTESDLAEVIKRVGSERVS
jgi:NTE family protein